MSTDTVDIAPDLDRTPPNDVGAEQCVLGSMLLSKDAITDIASILTAGDFYRPAHAVIFDAILTVDRSDVPVDAQTMASHLIDTRQIDKVGGAPYLHTLISTVPTAANGVHYARTVASRAKLRRLIETGTRIVQLGYGTIGGSLLDVDDAVEQAQAELHAATTSNTGSDFDWRSAVYDIIDTIEANAARKDGITGISTGYIDVDRLTGGWAPGQLITIAGRPGIGKSVAGVDAIRTAAFRNGKSVALFSIEMPFAEVGQRIASAESRVPLHAIRTGQLDDRDWDKVITALRRVEDANLHVDASPNITIADIRSRSRRLKQRKGLDLIVVDYMQLLTTANRRENRQQEVAELSRGLKLMAKELDCPVIALAQLNRGPEQRNDKRPQLADLRESGAIEQDSDVVVLLHRDDYYDKESPLAGSIDFIVAKQRNGPTDTITLACQLHWSRFADMAIEDRPKPVAKPRTPAGPGSSAYFDSKKAAA